MAIECTDLLLTMCSLIFMNMRMKYSLYSSTHQLMQGRFISSKLIPTSVVYNKLKPRYDQFSQ